MGLMHELPLTIASTYVGPTRHLTMPGLFRIFQDAAIADAEAIGFGHDVTMSQGLLWVFCRVYVRFHKAPEYLSNATFKTWPGARKAFLFPRFGKLQNEKGEVLAELSSIWALIHEDTRKLEMRPNLGDVDQTTGDEIPLPGKVVAKPCTLKSRRRIEYSDLDLNGHMNNVRYIELLLNLHEPRFYEEKMITELLIQYETEIKPEEVVEVLADEDITYVRGVVGDRVCFEANLTYGPVEK